MALHISNRGAAAIVESLRKQSATLWANIERAATHAEVYVLSDVTSGRLFKRLCKQTGQVPVSFVFPKHDYFFIGPWMRQESDACPYCLLLTLATDRDSLLALSTKTTQFSLNHSLDDHSHAFGFQDVVCLNTRTGSLQLFPAPLAHAACDHIALVTSRELRLVTPVSTVNEIENHLQNERTGVLRTVRHLSDFDTANRSKDADLDIALVWFMNPAFPFYPESGPTQLAIGVGVSPADARRRAIFEAIERHSLLAPKINCREVVATWGDLPAPGIDPLRFAGFDERQTTRSDFPYAQVTRETIFDWCKGADAEGNAVLVPADYVFVSQVPPSTIFPLTSSGCAAHHSYASACLRAFLEILERDAILRHWASGVPRPHVSTIDLPAEATTCLDFLTESGWDAYIIDASRWHDVYVFEILCENIARRCLVASGAALTPDDAITSAFREIAGCVALTSHCDATLISESGGGMSGPDYHRAFYADRQNYELLQHYRRPKGVRRFTEYKATLRGATDDVKLRHLATAAQRRGCDVVFVDLTPVYLRHLGIYVVRCVCPQMVALTFGTGMLPLRKMAQENRAIAAFAWSAPHPFG
jgi:thiazole/oxazole-forming peptide maturase SagD family component